LFFSLADGIVLGRNQAISAVDQECMMDESSGRITTLIQELGNGRVFRAATVYLASGFALLEAL
jgi:hypothetical protein